MCDVVDASSVIISSIKIINNETNEGNSSSSSYAIADQRTNGSNFSGISAAVNAKTHITISFYYTLNWLSHISEYIWHRLPWQSPHARLLRISLVQYRYHIWITWDSIKLCTAHGVSKNSTNFFWESQTEKIRRNWPRFMWIFLSIVDCYSIAFRLCFSTQFFLDVVRRLFHTSSAKRLNWGRIRCVCNVQIHTCAGKCVWFRMLLNAISVTCMPHYRT